MQDINCKIIARVRSDFPDKFGIPRQSGLVEELRADIIFEPEYRNAEACRGLEGYSHLWLIWLFSASMREEWSPTVRPPKLGGNRRVGVFASRSPFRPNPLALSCVRLESVEYHAQLGPILHVSGADLMDGTPILDIKPYLAYTDSHPEAESGFAPPPRAELEVLIPDSLRASLPPQRLAELSAILAQDPRPAYQHDNERVYAMRYAGLEIRFRVEGDRLTILSAEQYEE